MATNATINKKLPCNVIKCWKWNIALFIDKIKQESTKYAVLVLNRPITQKQNFLKSLWNNATIRVTVDGGTTHWDNFLKGVPIEDRKGFKLPELITGDFDSITKDILEEYKEKGCKALYTPDQKDTDFTKALVELYNYSLQQDSELDHFVTICQNSGRIDQILGNIQTLFLVKERQILPPYTKLYIISDDSVSWLLLPGDHVIFIPEESRKYKRTWCSLVPVGESCERVTTSGLKWDLYNEPLKYGELISTSNTFEGSELVKIKCSHPLLWSMRVPSLTEKHDTC